MKLRQLACFVVFLSMPVQLFLPLTIGATTVRYMDLDGLVSGADRIVVGRVIDSRTVRSRDGRLILTRHRIAVSESLKGEGGAEIEVTLLGGRLGGVTLHVAGMPTFSSGEHAVVFLEESGSYQTVLGLSQGKFSVQEGIVSNNLSGLRFTRPDKVQPLRMELESFRREVRSRVLKSEPPDNRR